LNLKGKDGKTALVLALENGKTEVVRLLKNAGARL
jgi:ankyrin repeat protein